MCSSLVIQCDQPDSDSSFGDVPYDYTDVTFVPLTAYQDKSCLKAPTDNGHVHTRCGYEVPGIILLPLTCLIQLYPDLF
jgi:hypothetical protein